MKTITLDQWKVALTAVGDAIAAQEKHLNELDSLIGDGDHGSSMKRGFEAVRSLIAVSSYTTVGELFSGVGSVLLQEIGGAVGPLLGSFFTAAARQARELNEVDLAVWSAMFTAGVAKVRQFGKASPGDKTMLDALQPACDAFEIANRQSLPLQDAFRKAAGEARLGAEHTAGWVAKFGRAKFLGERAIGHQDPGATSIYLMLDAMAEALSRMEEESR